MSIIALTAMLPKSFSVRLMVFVVFWATPGYGQGLVFPRRAVTLAPSFLSTAEKKVDAIRPPRGEESVSIIFQTSEQGWVIGARAISGSLESRQSALAAILKWKFKPVSINGQPVQIFSALTFDFSVDPVRVLPHAPMRSQDVSSFFLFKCADELLRREIGAIESCRKQMAMLEDPLVKNTPIESFTARDEYGLALLECANDPASALEQFNEAIRLAPNALKPSDAEWAYVYWHRATAEQHLAKLSEAEHDLATAESSMRQAEEAIGITKIADYYEGLLKSIASQRASLLNGRGKD